MNENHVLLSTLEDLEVRGDPVSLLLWQEEDLIVLVVPVLRPPGIGWKCADGKERSLKTVFEREPHSL